MAVANNGNDLYEVILIESDDDFAVLCPGIPGAVSQGKDREEALKMIADAMAMAQMYPLPGDDDPARQAELREIRESQNRGVGGGMRGRGPGVLRLRSCSETDSAMAGSRIADAAVHTGRHSAGTAADFAPAQFQRT